MGLLCQEGIHTGVSERKRHPQQGPANSVESQYLPIPNLAPRNLYTINIHPPRWIPSSYPAQCVCAKTYLDVVGMHQPRTIFGTPRFDSGEGCLARHPTAIHGSREYVRRPLLVTQSVGPDLSSTLRSMPRMWDRPPVASDSLGTSGRPRFVR